MPKRRVDKSMVGWSYNCPELARDRKKYCEDRARAIRAERLAWESMLRKYKTQEKGM